MTSWQYDCCENPSHENWDCYCTHGCEGCNKHKRCKNCKRLLPLGKKLHSFTFIQVVSRSRDEMTEKLKALPASQTTQLILEIIRLTPDKVIFRNSQRLQKEDPGA